MAIHVNGLLTFDGTLPIQFGTQHPQTENQDSQWKENSNSKADTPNCGKMGFPSSWKNNQKDRHRERSTELIRIFDAVSKIRVGSHPKTHAEDEIRDHDEDYVSIWVRKRQSMAILQTWTPVLRHFLIRCLTCTCRRCGIFTPDPLRKTWVNEFNVNCITYDTSDSSCKSQKPK